MPGVHGTLIHECEADVVQRLGDGRPRLGRAVERQVVASVRKVDAVLVRSPNHLQPQNLAVEALAGLELSHVECDVL